MIEQTKRIRKNTFRIYQIGGREVFGSAFAISEKTLLTAYHVVDNKGKDLPEGLVCMKEPDGQNCTGRVVASDSEADIARIDLEESLNLSDPLSLSEHRPMVGSSCIWGGFPRLVGESSPRLRYALGMVSSDIYEIRGGLFVEIDGNFSPGHSGSAILDVDSGEVIGVVSRSAGDLQNQLRKLERRLSMTRRGKVRLSSHGKHSYFFWF